MKIALSDFSGISNETISKMKWLTNLPEDYRQFVMQFDSAVPEDNMVKGKPHVSVSRFISVLEIRDRAGRIDGFPDDAIPVAECPSGDYVYIDMQRGKVWFWNHEVDKPEELSSSFSEFIDRLVPLDLSSVNLKPGQVKSVVWLDPEFEPEF